MSLSTNSTIVHENKSQGVLWQFTRGPRVWTVRQQRFLCVGGEFHGQRLTAQHIDESKWATFYHQYNRAHRSNPEQTIWVFIDANPD